MLLDRWSREKGRENLVDFILLAHDVRSKPLIKIQKDIYAREPTVGKGCPLRDNAVVCR